MKEVLNDIYTDGCKEKKYRLSDFFNRWWDEYAQHPAEYITPEQYKAVNAIRVCRTTALGIDTYVCPDCGEVREISHSCKHRFCPSCGWRDTLKWAARMKEKMLQVRLENRSDCRTAYLRGNEAASCTHAHDYVMGRYR